MSRTIYVAGSNGLRFLRPFSASSALKHVTFMLACILILSISIAFAQVGTADIVGTVTDSTGGVLPNAMVTAKNLDTNLTRTQQTGSSGDYAFTLLPIGTYSITVASAGFKMFSAPHITIATGDRARVDAQMQVGAVSQTIEVQAEVAAAIQTDSATVGSLITSQATQDLPLNGRNIMQLATLTVGANEGPQSALNNGTRPDDRRQTSTIVANGQGASSNNYMLDGMDNNERMIATIIVKPSVDAIQEVKTQTNLYTAENGRAAGAVINMITKSGSNTLHGDAFEFLRNDIFDAKSYFNQPQAGNPLANVKPEYRQNQFGGSLGGALKKDKLFFFGDYEGLRIIQGITSQPSGSGLIPTACELGQAACNGVTQLGNFSDLLPSPTYDCRTVAEGGNPLQGPTDGCIYDPATTGVQYTANNNAATWFPGNIVPSGRLDAISKNYAGLIQRYALPESTCGASYLDALVGCQFRFAPNTIQYFHTGDLRFDQHIGSADNVFERYTINNVDGFYPGALPPVKVGSILVYPGSSNGNSGSTSFPGTSYQRAQSASVGETHIFRPNLLLQVNLQVARYASESAPPDFGIGVNTILGGPSGVSGACAGCTGLAPFSFGGFTAYAIIGDAFALPTEYFDTNYMANAALTWTKGPHTLKFGGAFIRRYYNVFNSVTKGNFAFSSRQTDSDATVGGSLGGNAFASMLLGVANSESQSYQVVPQEYRTNEFGAFMQDDWRATRKLTLNLGIRWDVFAPITEKHNNLANFDALNPAVLAGGMTVVAGRNGSITDNIQTQFKDFQPRLGFAYTVGHGLVLRGGFGTTNYPDNTSGPSVLRQYPASYRFSGAQPPTISYPVTTVDIDTGLPPGTVFNNCVAAVCGENAAAFQLTRGFLSAGGTNTSGWKYPTIYQYNLIVEKEFRGNVLGIGYVGENARNLASQVNWNGVLPPNGPGGVSGLVGYTVTPSGAHSKPCMSYNYRKYAANPYNAITNPGGVMLTLSPVTPGSTPNSCQPFFNQLPLVTSTSLLTAYGRENYNALQVQFQRRFRNGLTFASNYVWAQSLANVSEANACDPSCGAVHNNFLYDYGNSDYEIRHRVTATANYQLPFGKSKTGIEGQLVKGWQVNGIWVWSSGVVFSPEDSEGLVAGVVDPYRVNQLPQQPFTKSLNEWFNTNDFQQQPFGTVSTKGTRGAFFGPSFTHFDFSLFKDISLTERLKLQFRYEVFNLFNTPAFSPPNLDISGWQQSASNPAPCAGNGSDPNFATCVPSSSHTPNSFGSITSTNTYYTPRKMQFALKLSF